MKYDTKLYFSTSNLVYINYTPTYNTHNPCDRDVKSSNVHCVVSNPLEVNP